MTLHNLSISNSSIRFLFFSFVLLTLFDPMDKLIGLKVPIFCLCMFLCFVTLINTEIISKLPISMIIVIFLLILIPLQSIFFYFLNDGNPRYEGFMLLKAYLFSTFSIFIYVYRIDAFKYIAIACNILAIAILLVSLIIILFPEFAMPLYHFGNKYVIFSIDQGRSYGGEQAYFQSYFVTSSMLVISIGYYFNRLFHEGISNKILLILCINIFAMFLAGTRNNMIISLILPFALWLQFTNKKTFITILILILSTVIIITFKTELFFFFSITEPSNFAKLQTLHRYLEIFSSDTNVLIFGQGIGSYETWPYRGDKFITELTYFEIIRSYGIFVGLVLIFIMFLPLLKTIYNQNFKDRFVFFPYLFYLIMSATNPLYFSSMGMLIFSAYIASLYLHKKRNET